MTIPVNDTYVSRLYRDLAYLRRLLNERRGKDSDSFEGDKYACAFCAIYLTANARNIQSLLDSLFDQPEEVRKQHDPYPDSWGWKDEQKGYAESAINLEPRPPDFFVKDDWINMLMRALEISYTMKLSPHMASRDPTLLVSPAAKCFEALESCGNLGCLYVTCNDDFSRFVSD